MNYIPSPSPRDDDDEHFLPRPNLVEMDRPTNQYNSFFWEQNPPLVGS